MEVSPTGLSFDGSTCPTKRLACQDKLDALDDRRLARTVASGYERKTRVRRQSKLALVSDAAKAPDSNALYEESSRRLVTCACRGHSLTGIVISRLFGLRKERLGDEILLVVAQFGRGESRQDFSDSRIAHDIPALRLFVG